METKKHHQMRIVTTNCTIFLLLLIALVATPCFPRDQQDPENEEALEAYSAKQLSKIAAQSKEFKIEKPYGETYETVLKWVKENAKLADTSFLIPYEAEVADKETGQISTTLGVSRNWDHLRNAPQRWLRRLIITLIKNDDSSTTVRVAITKRKRHYQRVIHYEGRGPDEIPTGSWGNPKVNKDESKEWANRIKAALQSSILR
jgi:hypothetical protein